MSARERKICTRSSGGKAEIGETAATALRLGRERERGERMSHLTRLTPLSIPSAGVCAMSRILFNMLLGRKRMLDGVDDDCILLDQRNLDE